MCIVKKVLSVTLALSLVFTLVVSALTAVAAYDDGQVTVKDAKVGETYSFYRVLNIIGYNNNDTPDDPDDDTFTYEINSAFQKFFDDNLPEHLGYSADTARDTITYQDGTKNENGDSINYPAYTDGHANLNAVLWCLAGESNADAKLKLVEGRQAFADKLVRYIRVNGIKPEKTTDAKADGDTVVAHETGLKYGYYLMIPSGDTPSVFFSLSNVTKTATIENKSQYPEPKKYVKDEYMPEYNSCNTAQVGDTMDFKVTCVIPDMMPYEKYRFVITDTMGNFEYVKDSAELAVLYPGTGNQGQVRSVIPNPNSEEQSYYTVTNPTEENNQLTIAFADLKAVPSVAKGRTLELTYKAKLKDTSSLVIGGRGNENAVFFTYSSDPTNDPADDINGVGATNNSKIAKTTTFVLQLKLQKVDESGNPLSGTTWKLWKMNANNKYVEVDFDYVVGHEEDNKITYVDDAEHKQNPYTNTDNTAGQFTWTGLDRGSYRLTEESAPAGYTKSDPIDFVISSNGTMTNFASAGYTDTTLRITPANHPNVLYRTEGSKGVLELLVENDKQGALPGTGGAGLYIVAGVAIVALLGFGGTAMLKRKVNGED